MRTLFRSNSSTYQWNAEIFQVLIFISYELDIAIATRNHLGYFLKNDFKPRSPVEFLKNIQISNESEPAKAILIIIGFLNFHHNKLIGLNLFHISIIRKYKKSEIFIH